MMLPSIYFLFIINYSSYHPALNCWRFWQRCSRRWKLRVPPKWQTINKLTNPSATSVSGMQLDGWRVRIAIRCTSEAHKARNLVQGNFHSESIGWDQRISTAVHCVREAFCVSVTRLIGRLQWRETCQIETRLWQDKSLLRGNNWESRSGSREFSHGRFVR